MKSFFSFIIVATFLLVFQSQAQVTYTSNGSCTSLTNALCWTKSGSCNTSNIPVFLGTSTCQINIVINHPISIAGNLNLDSYVNITVNTGGSLNVGGSIIVADEAINTSINVNGGSVTVAGNLTLNSGKVSNKTNLLVDIRNSGSFNVNGALNVNNDATLTITGDGLQSSVLNVQTLNLGIRSTVNIQTGGGLYSNGTVSYNGNNSQINVSGYFRTSGSVEITGGAGNQLNSFGNAQVIIEQNLDVKGNSAITFGGTSQVDVGGNVIVSGGSSVTTSGSATVFVCGTFPNNIPSQGCRLLPVDYAFFKINYFSSSRTVLLSWATAKEWENSHFEIQRAVNNLNNWQNLGNVQGHGWSDDVVEYSFEDNNLPFAGGNVFYRLKQVDLSGTFEFSKVVSVKVPQLSEFKGVWKVYPNPTNGYDFKFELIDQTKYKDEPIQVRLSGPIATQAVFTSKDLSVLTAELQQVLQQSKKGVYILQVTWGQNIEHIKILKQ